MKKNNIYITHMLWSKRAIGIASRSISKVYENVVIITIEDKNNERLFKKNLYISFEKLRERYPEEVINKNNLMGFYISEKDFPLFYKRIPI